MPDSLVCHGLRPLESDVLSCNRACPKIESEIPSRALVRNSKRAPEAEQESTDKEELAFTKLDATKSDSKRAERCRRRKTLAQAKFNVDILELRHGILEATETGPICRLIRNAGEGS